MEWKGQIEIFWLTGHPVAKRCFAWLEERREEGTESKKPVTVLEIPPVIGPATAVRSALGSASFSESVQKELGRLA